MTANGWYRIGLGVIMVVVSYAMTAETTRELDMVGHLKNKAFYRVSVFLVYMRGMMVLAFDLLHLFPIE